MENKEIKALKDAQLNEKMVELRKEQMNLRFQKATGQMENPNRWREVRKTIAKLKTEAKKALAQNGKYVSVDDGLLELRSEYFIKLKELVESGHIKAVIDKTFPLEQIVEAHRYVDTGHKKGNVVITI